MRRVWADQRGISLIELVVASGLMIGVVLVATAAETSLARVRADTRQGLLITEQLQTAMTPLLRDISGAWVPSGNAVALGAPTGASNGCYGALTVNFGAANSATWSLAGTSLVRQYLGRTASVSGLITDLCFKWDIANVSVQVTVSMAGPNHSTRSLTSEAVVGGAY